MCTSVISARDCPIYTYKSEPNAMKAMDHVKSVLPESFLTSSVPYLKLDSFVVNINGSEALYILNREYI